MAITNRWTMGRDPIRRACHVIETLGPRVIVQIRERDLSTKTLFEWATVLAEVARECRSCVLINGRADIARSLRIGAHLGEHGLEPADARRLLGPTSIVSAARHSVEGVLAAAQQGANLVTLSPIFETEGKGPSLGADTLARAVSTLRSCHQADAKIFALGGINAGNVSKVWSTGVAGIAAIRSVWTSDPRQLLEPDVR